MLDLIVPQWAREWLGRQEATTVLLFLILTMLPVAAIYVGDQATTHIDKINASYERRNQSQIDANRESLQTIVQTYESDQERDEERSKRRDELIRDLIQRNGYAGELEPASDLP